MLYPFFHCAGYKAGWLGSILIGATIYPEAVLDVSSLTRKVESERITCLPGPPKRRGALARGSHEGHA